MTPFPHLAPGVLDVLPGDVDPSRYAALLRDARSSKRCPVLLAPTATSRLGDMPLPPDPIGAIDASMAADVLSAWSPTPCPPGCSCLEPFTDGFPTDLARVDGRDRSQEERTCAVATALVRDEAWLATMGVVEAARPADVPAVLGWSGPCNYAPERDLIGLSAVLRSWEERFGAVVVVIHGSALVLSVADPPTTRGTAERVAAEHFAFCPNQHDPQDGRTVYTPRTYARKIRGKKLWRFWWD